MTTAQDSGSHDNPTNRRHFLKLVSAATLAAPACIGAREASSTAKEEAGEWIQLFNGRNLDGWTPKIRGYPAGENFANTFRVEDGLLTVGYEAYDLPFRQRFGHLFYKDTYSHYRLRAEYRFIRKQVEGGPGWAIRNSGFMLHGQTPESMTVDQDFPVSIEAQILGGDGERPRTTMNLCTPGTNVVMDGKLFTPHCTQSSSKTYHGEQWVTAEMEVHGKGIIKHILEGEVVLQYEQSQLDERDASARRLLDAGHPKMIEGGTISLQSESHPVQFRKVEIMPMGA